MANRKYTKRIRTSSGYDTYYPKTTAEQVVTDSSNRFTSDSEMDGKAPLSHVSTVADGATYGHMRFPTSATSSNVPVSALPFIYNGVSAAYDLNSYCTAGIWTLYNPTSSSNNFPADWGSGTSSTAVLEVLPFYSNTAVRQILHKRGSNQIWVRHSTSATAWVAWERLDGKADVSHTHDAGDISSGTLPIANGGTGLTSAPSLLINLASTTATSPLQASPRPGVTGTLPVARGGTGATTLTGIVKGNGTGAFTAATAGTDYVIPSGNITGSAATLATPRTIQTNLASTSTASFDGSANITPGVTGTLPIANGGTGQTSVASALKAFGVGYGTCSTSASTTAKVGTLSGFVRSTGAVVGISFTNANTNAAPTLNVNSTGAASIIDYRTKAAPASGTMLAGVHFFQFNGSQWVLLNPAVIAEDKKTATLVVGTMQSGHTAADVDYLCTGTNDHVQINAAINALPSTGGKVVIREGTYNVGDSIEINKNNVILEGMGSSTVIKASGDIQGYGVICVNDTSSNIIRNLKIDDPYNRIFGIYISGYEGYNTIEKCDIYAIGGIELQNSFNTVINNRIPRKQDNYSSVVITATPGSTVEGNMIIGNYLSKNPTYVEIEMEVDFGYPAGVQTVYGTILDTIVANNRIV